MSWKYRQEGGSCASGNPDEMGGQKTTPSVRGCVYFFWNNPLKNLEVSKLHYSQFIYLFILLFFHIKLSNSYMEHEGNKTSSDHWTLINN